MRNRVFVLTATTGLLFLLYSLSGQCLAQADIPGFSATSLSTAPPGPSPLLLTVGEANATGAFTTALEIERPTGRLGVQPNIRLEYNSFRGNGFAGTGWTLAGLPTITRMPHLHGVNYHGAVCQRPGATITTCPEDAYAFSAGGFEGSTAPGARLIYDEDRGRYVTRDRDNILEFQAVKATGQFPEMAGKGPVYWIMRDGSGNTYYFGGDAETLWELHHTAGHPRYRSVLWELDNGVWATREIRTWFLHKVEDPHGNSYRVFYTAGDTPPVGRTPYTLIPQRIIYTLNDHDPDCHITYVITGSQSGHWDEQTSHCREIRFEFQSRPDRPPMPYRYDQRLSQIDVLDSGQVLHRYVLEYADDSDTGESRLRHFRRCSAAGDCLPHHTFTYGSDIRPPGSAQPLQSRDVPVTVQPRFWEEKGDCPTTADYILGFFTFGISLAIQDPCIIALEPGHRSTWTSHVGDFDADGYQDVVRVYQGTHGRIVHVSYGELHALGGTRNVTIFQDDENYVGATSTVTHGHQSFNWYAKAHSFVGDMNGDGFDDLILPYVGHDFWRIYYVLGGPDGLETTGPDAQGAYSLRMRRGPRQDAGPLGSRWSASLEQMLAGVYVLAGDINGDQAIDIVAVHPHTRSGAPWIRWAFGGDLATGFSDLQPAAPNAAGTYDIAWDLRNVQGDPSCTLPCIREDADPSLNVYRGHVLRDFNGDGRDDIALVWSTDKQPIHEQFDNPSTSQIRILYALGQPGNDGFADLKSTLLHHRSRLLGDKSHGLTVGYLNYDVQFVQGGDINGDGRDELILSTHGPAGNYREKDYPYSREILAIPLPPEDADDPAMWRLVAENLLALPFQRVPLDFEPDDDLYTTPGVYAAYWRLHVADLNGDNIDDLLNVYAGEGGLLIHYYLGTPDGRVGPLITHTRFASQIDPSAPFPDGHPYVSKYESTTADLDGDGRSDLIIGYYGPDGTDILYALGQNDGLGTVDRLDNDGIGTAGYDWDVQLLTPDINGDGRHDIVLVNNFIRNYFASRADWPDVQIDAGTRRMRYTLSNAGRPPLDGIVLVQNGLGGRTSVEYKPAASFPDAIQNYLECTEADVSFPVTFNPLRVPTCVGLSDFVFSARNGVPDVHARHLVRRVTHEGGLNNMFTPTSVMYDYYNGRRFKGTIHGSLPGLSGPTKIYRWQKEYERQALGFEHFTLTDDQTDASVTAWFYHPPPLAGYPKRITRRNPLVAERGHLGIVTNFTWTIVPEWPTPIPDQPVVGVPNSPPQVNMEHATTLVYEGHNPLQRRIIRRLRTSHLEIDPFLNVTRQATCTDENLDRAFDGAECIHTRAEMRLITHPPQYRVTEPLGMVRWRPKSGQLGQDLILELQRYHYQGAPPYALIRVDRALAQNALNFYCRTLEDPIGELCTGLEASGELRWIPIVQNLRHDRYTGNLEYGEDALRSGTTLEHDAQWHTHVSAIINAMGHRTDFSFDAAGRLLTLTDPNRQVTGYGYDDHGRPVWIRYPGDPPDGSVRFEHLDWGTVGRQHTQIDRYSSATAFQRTEQYFDGLGRTWRTTATSAAGLLHVDTYTAYEAGGLVLRGTAPSRAGDDPRAIEIRHDGAGRPLSINRIIRPPTDPRWRPEQELGTTTYHSDGRITYTDAVGRSVTTELDAWGRLATVIDPGGQTTTYHYDDAGMLRHVELPQGETVNDIAFTYDSWGRVLTAANEARGTYQYVYDDVGNVLRITDARGRTIDLFYDALHRLTHVFVDAGLGPRSPGLPAAPPPGVHPELRFHYDTNGPGQGHVGRLARVEDPSGFTAFVYDARGRLLRTDYRVQSAPGPAPTGYEYAYDLQNRLVRQTIAHNTRDETVVDYRYLPDGELHEIHVDSLAVLINADFDVFGRARTQHFGNGVTASYAFDADERLDMLRTQNAFGQVLQHLSYDYDLVGNLTRIDDLRPSTIVGNVDTDASQTFPMYDELNRLRQVTLDRTGPAGMPLHYEYDALGNLTRKAGDLWFGTYRDTYYEYGQCGAFRCVTGHLSVPQSGRHHWQAIFDEVGNRRSLTTWNPAGPVHWTYDYDAFNNLILAEQDGTTRMKATYNYNGRRVGRYEFDGSGSAVKTYYLGPHFELRESEQQPGLYQRTVYITDPGGRRIAKRTLTDGLAGEPLAVDVYARRQQPIAGSTHDGFPAMGLIYYHPDHLGSSTLLTDNAGEPILRGLFRPFGALWRDHSVGLDVESYKFTGQEEDASTGLMNFRTRAYDPLTGSFLSADPLVPGGGVDAQGFNRYAYVYNNPANYVDPTGHLPSVPASFYQTLFGPAGIEPQEPPAPTFDALGAFGWLDTPAEPPIRTELLRFESDPRFENAVAGHYAALGYLKPAYLIEIGHGCAACHITHFENAFPSDDRIDLDRYFAVASVLGAARATAELLVFSYMGAVNQFNQARRTLSIYTQVNDFEKIVSAGRLWGQTEGSVYGMAMRNAPRWRTTINPKLRNPGTINFRGQAAYLFRPHPVTGPFSFVKHRLGQYQAGFGDIVFLEQTRVGNTLIVSRALLAPHAGQSSVTAWARAAGRIAFDGVNDALLLWGLLFLTEEAP